MLQLDKVFPPTITQTRRSTPRLDALRDIMLAVLGVASVALLIGVLVEIAK